MLVDDHTCGGEIRVDVGDGVERLSSQRCSSRGGAKLGQKIPNLEKLNNMSKRKDIVGQMNRPRSNGAWRWLW